MTQPYVNKGKRVYINPTIPVDGGVVMDPAIAIPDKHGVEINGAPVIEQSQEYVIRKKPESNAQD